MIFSLGRTRRSARQQHVFSHLKIDDAHQVSHILKFLSPPRMFLRPGIAKMPRSGAGSQSAALFKHLVRRETFCHQAKVQ